MPDSDDIYRLKEMRHDDPGDFELATQPATDPSLDEFLPAGAQMPAPFDATGARRHTWTAGVPTYIADDWVTSEYALCVYGPHGDPAKGESHAVCRVTLLAPDRRGAKEVEAYHTERLWQTFDGDPTRQRYSDWVSESFDRRSTGDHDRTVYSCRAPRIDIDDKAETTRRPVVEQAIHIQSVDWGLIEIGAYLTPTPTEDEARDLVATIADSVITQVSAHPTPTPRFDEQFERHA